MPAHAIDAAPPSAPRLPCSPPAKMRCSLFATFLFLRGAAAALHVPSLPVVAGPVVNGIELADPGLGANQPLVKLGFLDVTRPPFSADPTGAADCTAALQAAVDFGRRAYLVVGVPPGSYRVNSTINLVQPTKLFRTTVGSPECNNMPELYNSTVYTKPHCARTAPAVLKGIAGGDGDEGRPRIVLSANSGLKGPVVLIHNPLNDNVNMNQVMSGIDIEVLPGNPSAVGVSARGAQGVSVQDVTIYAGDAAIGLQGGAGSGGSHIGVTVVGGQVGVDVSSSQPAPTLTAITLIGQLRTALVYSAPGRQTLSITGLNITSAPSATGPAISAGAPLSLYDVSIDRSGPETNGTAIVSTANVFLKGVHVRGYDVLFARKQQQQQQLSSPPPSPAVTPATTATDWTLLAWFADGTGGTAGGTAFSSKVWLNGTDGGSRLLTKEPSSGPAADLVSQHLFPSEPALGAAGVCNVKEAPYNAKGDYFTDDTAAVQKALSDPACFTTGVFFPKGYFSVTQTLQLSTTGKLIGASRIYSNIVPHPSIERLATASKPAWPLVETAAGPGSSATFVGLSILVWHHVNATFALHWQAKTGVWRESHINRVSVSPGLVGPPARFNRPLMVMDGSAGGKFWNFYQENWEYQGPAYRHLLVDGTDQPLHFYHLNTEHSQGEANAEFRGVTGPLRIAGFKGEGNYAQLWFSNCSDVLVLGYGGNASPFPFNCPYPPGYTQYAPSLIRVERCTRVVLANLITQSAKTTETRCGLFDTGFAGTFYKLGVWRSVLELPPGGGANVSTPSLEWPVMWVRGDVASMI